eukprot:m.141441 g.141441  ORF g.141441 m.141441 type:complete len:260 (+) comp14037_c1_seq11:172-951(+)
MPSQANAGAVALQLPQDPEARRDVYDDYVEQFRIESDKRVEKMRAKIRYMKGRITRVYKVELMKIPKRFRDMTIKQFREALVASSTASSSSTKAIEEDGNGSGNGNGFKTPAQNVRRSTRTSTARRSSRSTARKTATKAKTVQNSSFKTPATARRMNAGSRTVAATPVVRQARDGEVLMSENGSPVASSDLTTIRVGKHSRGRVPEIQVPIGNGKAMVCSSEEDVTSAAAMLSKKQKEYTKAELQMLKQQVDMMLKCLV